MIDLEWRAENRIWTDSIELVAFQRGEGKRGVVSTEFTIKEIEDGYLIDEPTLRLVGDEAQQIMNELWRVGIRPKDGSGAVAHTEAISAHLADMRTIAFNRLKIDQ